MPVAMAQKVRTLSVDFRSAARLADLLGVSRSQVTRWLRGAGIDPLNAEKVDLLELVWSNLLRLYDRDAALSWLEARQAVGVECERVRQDLDGDVSLQLRVARAIHLPHAAGANQSDDLILAEAAARSQGHDVWRESYTKAGRVPGPARRRAISSGVLPVDGISNGRGKVYPLPLSARLRLPTWETPVQDEQPNTSLGRPKWASAAESPSLKGRGSAGAVGPARICQSLTLLELSGSPQAIDESISRWLGV
jgi:hypothetical protein